MSLGCRDLERVLQDMPSSPAAAQAGSAAPVDGDPGLEAELEDHARGCPACARELGEWRQLSQLALGLQKRWDSPGLEARIQQALATERPRSRLATWLSLPLAGRWRLVPALALGVVLVGAATGLWMNRPRPTGETLAGLWQSTSDPLLTDQAVDAVEAAERQYVAAIDQLSKLAAPAVAGARSPLANSYREKLTLLDAAIAELQAGIDGNRLNSHLRRELLAMYREKQQTLDDLMRIARQPRVGEAP